MANCNELDLKQIHKVMQLQNKQNTCKYTLNVLNKSVWLCVCLVYTCTHWENNLKREQQKQ